MFVNVKKIFTLLMLIFFFSSCQKLFLFPSKKIYSNKKKFNFKINEIYINYENVKINAYEINPKSKKEEIFIILHGNAQNISAHINKFIWLANMGYKILIFDYQGYGKSSGEASIQKAIKDIKNVLIYAKNKYKKPLIIIGQSLGGSLGLYTLTSLKNQNFIKLIILDSSFSSYKRIAKDKLSSSFLTYPFLWLNNFVSDEFSPLKNINKLSTNILIIHSTLDNIVAPYHSYIIFDNIKSSFKELWLNKKYLGHTNALLDKRMQNELFNLIKDINNEKLKKDYFKIKIFE